MYLTPDSGRIMLGEDILGTKDLLYSVEIVQVLLSADDDSIDFTQYQIQVQQYGQVITTYDLDASGSCTFSIPLGELYTIWFPTVINYSYLPEITNRAVLGTRVVSKQYHNLTNQIRSVVLERSNPDQWETSGPEEVVDSILGYGTYVLDDVHKKYAKLNPLNHTEFLDGTPYTGTYGDVFKHIPEVFYRMTENEDQEPVLQVSMYNLGAGSHSWPESWIGTYKGHIDGNGVLRSIPNVSTTQSKTMSQFWEAAGRHTQVGEYGLVNYFDHCKILALMYAKYGKGNSESVQGAGLQNAGQSYYTHTTGTTAQLGDASGSMQYLTTSFQMCKLFGIEDLAGSTWEFRPNIRMTLSQYIIYEGNIVSNDAQGVRVFSRSLTSANQSFITKMELGDYCDFVPKTVGGTSANYYCDGCWTSTSGQLLVVGGAAGDGSLCGLSAVLAFNDFGVSNAGCGARLAFKGEISTWEEVTGEDLDYLNS